MQQQPRTRNRVKIISKHPDDHYDHYGPCFILILLIVAGLIVGLVVAANSSNTETHTFARDREAALRLQKANAPRPCVTGEVLDPEVNRCLPALRTPSAADPSILERSVKPCDSFFQHICGKWIGEHSNEDRAFSAAYYRNQRHIQSVIEEAPKDESPIGAFYHACVSSMVEGKYKRETQMERNHMIRVVLDNFKKHADLPRAFGRMARAGYTIPFSMAVEKHPLESRMILILRWDGFDLQEIGGEAGVTELFSGSRDKGASLLESAMQAELFMGVQQRLKEKHMQEEDDIESYTDYLESGHFVQDLVPLITFDGWDWQAFFEEVDGTAFGTLARPDDMVWCPEKMYLQWLIPNLSRFTIAEWTAYLRFSIIYHTHEFVPQLPSNVYMKRHAFAPVGKQAVKYQAHLIKRDPSSGTHINKLQCVHLTQQLLPGLVSREFLKRAFTDPEEVRARVVHLGREVRDQVAAIVDRSTWLDAVSRRNLARKVRSIIVRAVHPNMWTPEPFAASLSPDRYLHNLNLVRRWRVRQNLVLWSAYALKGSDGRVDRDLVARFGAPLSTVNAFYSPVTNTITIFAGILQPPFFHPDYDKASILATVGVVLGHEFSHSIDSNGARFDDQGNFRPLNDGWISQTSMERFRERQACVVDEYSVIDLGIDCSKRKRDAYGEHTLGENMADIVGVRAAYETYLRLANETEKADGVRPWWWVTSGQMWCESYDQQHLCDRVENDVHSTSVLRVDKTFRNLKEFAQDWGCVANVDRMARPDEDRCTIFG